MNTLYDSRKFNFTIIENDIFERTDIDIYEQSVYIVLCRYANKDSSQAFPRYTTIAEKGKMCLSKAKQCVKSLIKKGLIIKEHRYTQNGDNTSNLYTVLSASENRGGSVCDTPPRACDTPPRACDTPELINLTKPNINNNTLSLGENSGNSETDDAQEIIETYNDICENLAKVSQVTKKRISKLNKIQDDLIKAGYKPLTVFKAVFLKVHTTKFFNGGNRIGWKANFDWLLEDDRIIRILEGQYDEEIFEGDIGLAVLNKEVL
jgi:hypothetical protein